LCSFVDLKARLLQVLDHPLCDPLSRIVAHMLLKEPVQKIPAATDREADRKGKLVDRPIARGLSS
jgi:hypothetical protein